MCDNLLIDLSGWNEPVKEEIVIEEPVLVEANSFKGPYDPFDSVEKEACLMVSVRTHICMHTYIAHQIHIKFICVGLKITKKTREN